MANNNLNLIKQEIKDALEQAEWVKENLHQFTYTIYELFKNLEYIKDCCETFEEEEPNENLFCGSCHEKNGKEIFQKTIKTMGINV